MQFSSWYFIFFFFMLYCTIEKHDLLQEFTIATILAKINWDKSPHPFTMLRTKDYRDGKQCNLCTGNIEEGGGGEAILR